MEHEEPENPDVSNTTRPIQPELDLGLEVASANQVLVRPDLNLEKWPLWEASNSRHQARARTLQREIRLPDGSVVAARVEVGYSNHGTLTTEDQKTCYGLFKLWDDMGRPSGRVHFSRQQLARVLRKSWGSKVNKAITDSLMRLRFTPFVWEHSYFDSGRQETLERIDTFNILSELHLVRRTRAETTVGEGSYFEFNERILANLMAGFTRPVYLDTILAFQSEIAQILYTYLDLVMADKTRFERRTRELFQDLGIDGTTYRYPSKRAQILEPALSELNGVQVPTGVLYASLERTADESDFKIVVTKTRRAARGRGKTADPQPPALPPPVVTRVVNAPPDPSRARKPKKTPVEPEVGQDATRAPEVPQRGAQAPSQGDARAGSARDAADQQVRHFYQIFFQSGDGARPTPRERQLAAEHVERLGVEAAQYLVLFALRESRKTGFQIQNYGGVAQYEGRAVAEMEANERQRRQALEQRSRESHHRRHQSQFHQYLAQCLSELEGAPTDDIREFLDQEQERRGRLERGALPGVSATQRVVERFETPEARLERFRTFLKERMDAGRRVDGIRTFWEWDEELNPDRWKG